MTEDGGLECDGVGIGVGLRGGWLRWMWKGGVIGWCELWGVGGWQIVGVRDGVWEVG